MRLLLAAVLCLCLLALCACGRALPAVETSTAVTTAPPTTSEEPTSEETTTVAPTMPAVEPLASYRGAPAAYKPVLDDLYVLDQRLWSGEAVEAAQWEFRYDEDILGAWFGPIAEYAVADINGDGITELLIFTEGERCLRSLFTLQGDTPIALGAHGDREGGRILADGTICFVTNADSVLYCRLEPHATEITLYAGYYSGEEQLYFKMVKGEQIEISEEEYHAITEQNATLEDRMQLDYISIKQ